MDYFKDVGLSSFFLALLFFGWFFLLGFIRGTTRQYMSYFLPWFSFIPIWLVLQTENMYWEKFDKFLRYALIIEVVLGLSQYLFGIGYSSYVEAFAENGAENIAGTFKRYNVFADNMSLLILSTLAIRLVKGVRISILDFVLMSVGYVLVFYSGARTEFAALSVSLVLLLFARYRHSYKAVVVLFVLLVIVGARVMQGSGEEISRGDIENNEQRQFQAINAIGDSENAYLEEESTLTLSLMLVTDFMESDNYLLGPGKLFETKFGYFGLACEGGFLYDSFLALYLCETGLIGVVLLFLVLYAIIKFCRRPSFALPILAYLLLVSLTDFGLFQGNIAIFLFLCIGLINKYEEEKSIKEEEEYALETELAGSLE